MDRRLIVGDNEVRSVDELLRKVKDTKRQRRHHQDVRATANAVYGNEVVVGGARDFRSDRPLTHREAFETPSNRYGYN